MDFNSQLLSSNSSLYYFKRLSQPFPWNPNPVGRPGNRDLDREHGGLYLEYPKNPSGNLNHQRKHEFGLGFKGQSGKLGGEWDLLRPDEGS